MGKTSRIIKKNVAINCQKKYNFQPGPQLKSGRTGSTQNPHGSWPSARQAGARPAPLRERPAEAPRCSEGGACGEGPDVRARCSRDAQRATSASAGPARRGRPGLRQHPEPCFRWLPPASSPRPQPPALPAHAHNWVAPTGALGTSSSRRARCTISNSSIFL